MLKDCLVREINNNLNITVGRQTIVHLPQKDDLQRTSDPPDNPIHEWMSNLLSD